MMRLPDLINDLALILMTAGFVTLIFRKLKQPVVLGYSSRILRDSGFSHFLEI